MLSLLLALLGLVAVGAWLSALGHAVLLVGRRRPGVTAGQLVFQGYRFFDPDTFDAAAAPLHRRFLLSGAAFGAAVFSLGAAGALLAIA